LKYVLLSALILAPIAVAPTPWSPVALAEKSDRKETEKDVLDKSDSGICKIFNVESNGLHWYEAEDCDGNRFVIKEITSNSGVVDFGDGQGGRTAFWR